VMRWVTYIFETNLMTPCGIKKVSEIVLFTYHGPGAEQSSLQGKRAIRRHVLSVMAVQQNHYWTLLSADGANDHDGSEYHRYPSTRPRWCVVFSQGVSTVRRNKKRVAHAHP